MPTEPINLYKKREIEEEKRLGRKLTEDKKTTLMSETIGGIFEGTEIPDEEISDLEITGLKD